MTIYADSLDVALAKMGCGPLIRGWKVSHFCVPPDRVGGRKDVVLILHDWHAYLVEMGSISLDAYLAALEMSEPTLAECLSPVAETDFAVHLGRLVQEQSDRRWVFTGVNFCSPPPAFLAGGESPPVISLDQIRYLPPDVFLGWLDSLREMYVKHHKDIPVEGDVVYDAMGAAHTVKEWRADHKYLVTYGPDGLLSSLTDWTPS